MESPGGVTTVPAERISMIHEEMVAQRRTGVKVKGYGLTLSSWGENGQLHIKKVFSSVGNYAQALASLPTSGVYFGPQIGWLGMPVLHRVDLVTPRERRCIIEEYDATCVVLPRVRAALAPMGRLS